MIPKSSKFPLRTDFLAFRSSASHQASAHLRLLYSPHSPSRLSIIIPKKVNKLATTRNWLKRLSYDTLWPMIQDKNLDVVVVFKSIPLARSSATQVNIISTLSNLRI